MRNVSRLYSRSFSTRQFVNPINFHLYHYAGNNPMKYVDSDGMSTGVDENTGTIISAVKDNDCGVYAYPTVNGVRAEGPGLLIGLTGTPGYFAGSNSFNGIEISGQIESYLGKNIGNYGSCFMYGDYSLTNTKAPLIGTAMPNSLEMIGDSLSAASFALNCANTGFILTGQFAIAEGCGMAAMGCDIGATICYFAGGCNEKALIAGGGALMDLIPSLAYAVKPSLSPAYNMGAHRFINPSTGRFIKNTTGYRNYLIGPATGIIYSVGSNIYSNSKE